MARSILSHRDLPLCKLNCIFLLTFSTSRVGSRAVRPDECRLLGEDQAEGSVSHFGAVERHFAEPSGRRLRGGEPASERDISSEDPMGLREARAAVTLCPDCQDKVHPREVAPELSGMGVMTPTHLYAVPVLARFDASRNCPHCRRHSDHDCAAWRKAVTVPR